MRRQRDWLPMRGRPLAQVGRFPHLVIVEGYGAGRTYALSKGTVAIGRDPKCDIVLPYSTVSWHHASISKREETVTVHDLGSRNGTFVGLDRVQRRELDPGDLIRFGDRVTLKLIYLDADRALEVRQGSGGRMGGAPPDPEPDS
jgi:pSer/pThr/pTyr-binding forkhead associated (FHA) protein